MINWEEIRREYENSEITLATLSEKHGVKLGTLKSRKSREGWSRDAPSKDATKPQKVATIISRDATSKTESIREREVFVESEGLTDKQRLFCIYYLKYFNATKAYQKAYDCAYSTARVEGHRHLANPNINAEIDRLKAEQANELKLDVQDIIQKYIDIAFADITDYVSFGQREEQAIGMYGPIYEGKGDSKKPVMQTVNYVDLNESSDVDGTIIAEVKQGRDGISVKIADKMKALAALEKYVGFMSEEQKARIEVLKSKVPNKDQTNINAQITALADLINNPAPDRVIDDD